MPFDVEGARLEGATDEQIKEHFRPFFDVDGAMEAGATLEEIGSVIQFKKAEPAPEPEPPVIEDAQEIQDIATQVGVPVETIQAIKEIEKGRQMFAQRKVKELTREPTVPLAEPFQPSARVRIKGRGATGEWGEPTLAQETATALRKEAAQPIQAEATGAEALALGFATFPFAKTVTAKISAVMSDKPYEEALAEERESIKEIFELAKRDSPKLFKTGEIASDVLEFALINRLVSAYGFATGSISALSKFGKLSPIGRASKLFNEGFLFGSINKASEQLDDNDVQALGILGNGLKDGLAFIAFEAAGRKAIGLAKKPLKKPMLKLAKKLRSWADKKRVKFGQEEAEKVSDALDVVTELTEKEASAQGKLVTDLTADEAVSILQKNKEKIIKALMEGEGVQLLTPEEKFIAREIIAKEPSMVSIVNNKVPLKHPAILMENISDDGARLIKEEMQRGAHQLSEIPYSSQGGARFNFNQKLNAARKELNRLQKEAGLKKDYAVNIRLNAFSDEAQYAMINEAIKFHQQLANIKSPKILFAKIREQVMRKGIDEKHLNMLLDLDKEKSVATLDGIRLTMAANSRRRTELIEQGLQNTDEFRELTKNQNFLMQATVKLGDFAGTFLRTFREDVGRPALKGKTYRAWRDEILKSAGKMNKDVNKIKHEMSLIDLDDPIAAANLYDNHVAPKLMDLIDEYRYINMLSSPRTHLINTITNLGQVFFTAPSTKLLTAAIEAPLAFVSRRERNIFFGEATSYMAGVVTGGGNALKKASDAWAGRSVMRADLAGIGIRRINRTFGDLRKNFGFKSAVVGKIQNSWLWDKARIPIKALEASDAFFRTLAEQGELAGLGYANRYLPEAGRLSRNEMISKASESGLYYIFRQGLRPQGQGYTLNFIDDITQLIMNSRQIPVVGKPLGWMVPFIQTPVNIFKQGIEYSPAGLITVPGTANQRQQVAKAALGSLVTASAMFMGGQNRLIWEAPKGKKERDAFYGANLLPHSIIVGNRMVQFKYLGIYAYPLMLAASIQHHYNEAIAPHLDPNTKNALSNQRVKALVSMTPHVAASMVGFLGELPYAQNFGLLIDFVQQEEAAMSRFAANFVRQVTPFVGATSWFNRMNDEFVRKPEKFKDFIKMGVPWPPGLRDIPTFQRQLQSGEVEPAVRDERVFNAFTVATRQQIDKEAYEYYLQIRDERWQEAKQKEAEKEQERQKNIERARVFKILRRGTPK